MNLENAPVTLSSKLSSNWQCRFWLATSVAMWSSVLSGMSIANAQIAGDGSVGTQVNGNLVAPCSTGTCLITGGTRANSFLFHGFSQFTLPTGGEVVFDPAGAQTIFARVTGGSVSAINGRLATLSGSTNLFLLNPNGIIFGPNASLSIGGSFVATTADSIIFDNGARFSARDRTIAPPLLTISTPIGLQFGANSAPIVVQGTGNNLFLNPDNLEIVRDFRPVGLEVPSRETLALIGGDIRLEGGNLTAPQGRIELGSVEAGSLIRLISTNPGWSFDYSGISKFRDIGFFQAASIDASDNGGGTIVVQGQQVKLSEGSVILAKTLGDETGGNLTVKANSVELDGISPIAPLYTGIFADSASTATNRGGNVSLQAEQLSLTNGAQISSNTFGAGNAGTLSVRARTIDANGGSFLGPSGLFATVEQEATGTGGNLTIETQQLRLTDGAQIAATSFGVGATGTLTIKAKQIDLVGVFSDPMIGEQPSNLSVDMLENAIGQGGSLSIETDGLRIAGGAQISSATFGQGNAGSITIQAKDIDIRGGSASLVSGILAPVDFAATGRGGTITIQTERLTIADGAQIFTTTLGAANAGNLSVNASDFVSLTGKTENGRSGLFASAVFGSGSGGNLTVVSDRLFVQDGATISVSNFPSTSNSLFPPGQGSAGDLKIVARNVFLNNQALLTADTVVGNRANIEMQTNLLALRNGSRISTDAKGTASGGNIRIFAPNGFVVAVPRENSDITANAAQGNGGRVDITATSIYGIEPRARLTPLSDITVSSEFGVAGVVTLNTPYLNPVRGLLQVEETPNSPVVLQGCQPNSGRSTASRFTSLGRGGSRTQPTDLLTNQTILGDASLPNLWSEVPVSRSSPVTDFSSDSTVEAQGWQVNDQGQIVLVAASPSGSRGCQWQVDSGLSSMQHHQDER
jgi:filamentous hemagglutinin family protein